MNLQSRVYGTQRRQASMMKRAGNYNNPPMRKMGSYNHQVKRLGVYNGIGGGSNIGVMTEMYPRY